MKFNLALYSISLIGFLFFMIKVVFAPAYVALDVVLLLLNFALTIFWGKQIVEEE